MQPSSARARRILGTIVLGAAATGGFVLAGAIRESETWQGLNVLLGLIPTLMVTSAVSGRDQLDHFGADGTLACISVADVRDKRRSWLLGGLAGLAVGVALGWFARRGTSTDEAQTEPDLDRSIDPVSRTDLAEYAASVDSAMKDSAEATSRQIQGIADLVANQARTSDRSAWRFLWLGALLCIPLGVIANYLFNWLTASPATPTPP